MTTTIRVPRERITVQLVDDSEDDLLLTQSAIELAGRVDVVHVARNGGEALSYLRGVSRTSSRPDLVLLDMNIPVMDGFEVLAAIRNDPELQQFPVVILSGSAREQDIRRAYRGGAATYLRKSESFVELCTAIDRLAGYWREVASLPERVW